MFPCEKIGRFFDEFLHLVFIIDYDDIKACLKTSSIKCMAVRVVVQ